MCDLDDDEYVIQAIEPNGGVGTTLLPAATTKLFKDMPANVLCTFQVEQGEDVAVCEKQMLVIKDHEEVSYEEEYIILWPAGKQKQLERHACKLLLFHADITFLKDLEKKYTNSEMELEDIIRIRENNASVTKTQVSKSGRPRKITEKLKAHQQKTNATKKKSSKEFKLEDATVNKKISKKALERARNVTMLSLVDTFMEANEQKDQSFKKSEDISVDNDSFDSVGAGNEDLDQPVSETSERNCKDFTKKRFAQSNDSLKCSKKKKEDLKQEISLKYSPKKNSILKKESIIRLASLKSSMPAIQKTSPSSVDSALMDNWCDNKSQLLEERNRSASLKSTMPAISQKTSPSSVDSTYMDSRCDENNLLFNTECSRCEVLKDQLKVLTKRIEIWETLSNLERMQTYLSMVLIPEKLEGAIPKDTNTQVIHSPPFEDTLRTDENIPSGGMVENFNMSFDSDEPKEISETIINSIPKNQKMSLFVSDLMMKIFTTNYMVTHKMTEKGLGNKKAMNEEHLRKLIAAVQKEFKAATDHEIRSAIRFKFNNVCKKAKTIELKNLFMKSTLEA